MNSSYVKNAVLGVIAPTAGRAVSSLDMLEQWLRIASLVVGLGVGAISFAIAAVQLYRLLKDKLARHKKPKISTPTLVAISAALLMLASGCSFAARTKEIITGRAAANAEGIAEESRALTTGVVDALSSAPTNPPTNLALELAKKDQLLEGMPRKRIDVAGALAGEPVALQALRERYEVQEKLVAEKAAVETKLRETEARLIEMGQKYEAERNTHIVKRVWHWAIGTLGIGGLIALCIFFPFLIPILTNGAAFIVGKIPALAGVLGVVGTKAFDAVVRGVEKAKTKITDDGVKDNLHTQLSMSLDAAHKALVAVRKPKLQTA